MSAYVNDGATGERLPGSPSEELIRESLAVRHTGAVPAYRDRAGVWQYVAPSEEERYRTIRGVDVLTVWVEVTP